MLKSIIDIIRMAKIFKALEKEHNYQCSEEEVKEVVNYLLITNLSNKQIIRNILEKELSFEEAA